MDPVTIMALAGGAQLLGSYLGGEAQKDAAGASARAQIAALERSIQERQAGFQDVSGLMDPYYQAGLRALGDIQAIDPRDYMVDYGQFEYDRGVNEFLDPSMQYQAQQAQRALEGSAAARGGLLSGNTLRALQEQQSSIGAQDWGNAYNRMMQDKSFAYGQFQDRFNQRRAQMSDLYNRTMSKYGGLLQSGQAAANTMATARTGVATGTAGDVQNIGNVNAIAAQAPYQAQANFMQNLTSPNFTVPMMQLASNYMQPQQAQQANVNPYGLDMNLYNQMNPQQGNL